MSAKEIKYGATATILASAIYREGAKLVAAGVYPMSIKRGIDKAVVLVVEELKKMSIPTKDIKDIAQAGTMSANSDPAIGDMIADKPQKGKSSERTMPSEDMH